MSLPNSDSFSTALVFCYDTAAAIYVQLQRFSRILTHASSRDFAYGVDEDVNPADRVKQSYGWTPALLHQFDGERAHVSAEWKLSNSSTSDQLMPGHVVIHFQSRAPLVWIQFDLPGRQDRQIGMLRISPDHGKTLALALRVPAGSIFIFHRIREEYPTQDGLGAGSANPRLFKSLLLPGHNRLVR